MKKLIFLDIDGVLNTGRSVEYDNKFGRKFIDEMNLDNEALSNLRALIDVTGAELVLSSTWRLAVGSNSSAFSNIELKLSEYGMAISDITTRRTLGREREIMSYLLRHPFSRYVILDDQELNSKVLSNHLVLCDSRTGFDADALSRAIQIME